MSSDPLYLRFKKISYFLTGNALTPHGYSLLKDKMQSFCQRKKIKNLEELIDRLEKPYEDILRYRFIDVITVHETLFFRDQKCFSTFADVISQYQKSSPRSPLRVWSAACSVGAEPVSIAITMAEQGLHPKSVEIIASDISKECVEATRSGLFQEAQLLRGMSPKLKEKYFKNLKQDVFKFDTQWQSVIQTQRINLLDFALYPQQLDVIFCRYVLIYFSEDDKKKICEKLSQCLKPGGLLLLGGSEMICCSNALQDLKKVNGVSFMFQKAA